MTTTARRTTKPTKRAAAAPTKRRPRTAAAARPALPAPVAPGAASGRLHAPDGFRDAAGRRLVRDTPHEVFVHLSTCVETRCHICQLAARDPELLVFINEASSLGSHSYPEIIAICRERGHDFDPEQLTNHKREHFHRIYREYLLTAAAEASRTRTLEQALEEGHGLGSTIDRLIWAKVAPLLDTINVESAQFKKMPMPKRVAFLLMVSKQIARSENADSRTKLAQLDLMLKELKLSSGEERVWNRLMGELRAQCKDYPELWAVLQERAAALRRERRPALPGASAADPEPEAAA